MGRGAVEGCRGADPALPQLIPLANKGHTAPFKVFSACSFFCHRGLQAHPCFPAPGKSGRSLAIWMGPQGECQAGGVLEAQCAIPARRLEMGKGAAS